MRSARGYLDELVRSARPVAAATAGLRSAHIPGWGPTRIGDAIDEAEPAAPVEASPRAVTPTPVAATTAPLTTVLQTTDAATRPVAQRAEPLHPSPAAIPAALPARLPLGTESALERLEHVARRFSSTLEATVTPATPSTSRAEEPALAPRIEQATGPRAVAAAAPMPAARPAESPRVEIGSIEVFVTSPPAPAPIAASAPAFRVNAPAPERLSRPLATYAFGQG